MLTPRAFDYLAAQRNAARSIEGELRTELGPEDFAGLNRLLETLGNREDPRMRDYLSKSKYPDAR
jgi:hypothetical protein